MVQITASDAVQIISYSIIIIFCVAIILLVVVLIWARYAGHHFKQLFRDNKIFSCNTKSKAAQALDATIARLYILPLLISCCLPQRVFRHLCIIFYNSGCLYNLCVLLDQVSRHCVRQFPILIYIVPNFDKLCTKIIVKITYDVWRIKPTHFANNDLIELSYFSLALRHHLRDSTTSNEFQTYQMLETVQLQIAHQQKIIANVAEHSNRCMRLNRDTETINYDTWFNFLDFSSLQFDESIIDYMNSKLELIPSKAHIIIMLSGGVDSMCLVYLMLRLRTADLTFETCHINWQKRKESDYESLLLIDCMRALGVRHNNYVCNIDKNDPDWDAKSTLYRVSIMQLLSRKRQSASAQAAASSASAPVFFAYGHVITDVIENIIINTTQSGSKSGAHSCLELCGMLEHDLMHGVNIWRPLLLHPKPDYYGIPHLPDNAANLNVQRRVFRREGIDYDINRVRELYRQSLQTKLWLTLIIDTKFTLAQFIMVPTWLLQRRTHDSLAHINAAKEKIKQHIDQNRWPLKIMLGKHTYELTAASTI